ncbi:MAG: division/cell wall cluster transcriptional repressor MraZ [Bacteroidetes bacterium]|nr:MAG: division/cell wall cluster transcriptional repressor MraZ [Bacteroidota bacterium]
MLSILGEYDCKVDAKGRFMFPNGLKKQLGDKVLEKGFVVNRNLHQPCLVIYTADEWEKLSNKLSKLNRLIKKNDVFVRRVMGGATPVELDGSGRMLLPKSLIDYAGISKEIKVVGSGNVIEVWDKSKLEDVMKEDVSENEALAEEVFKTLGESGE